LVDLQKMIIEDAGRGVWQRAAAVAPSIGRELVPSRLDAPEVVIAEAALGALVWTDWPDEALPVLLRYADGDRARVVM
jgi:hypothetical protein